MTILSHSSNKFFSSNSEQSVALSKQQHSTSASVGWLCRQWFGFYMGTKIPIYFSVFSGGALFFQRWIAAVMELSVEDKNRKEERFGKSSSRWNAILATGFTHTVSTPSCVTSPQERPRLFCIEGGWMVFV